MFRQTITDRLNSTRLYFPQPTTSSTACLARPSATPSPLSSSGRRRQTVLWFHLSFTNTGPRPPFQAKSDFPFRSITSVATHNVQCPMAVSPSNTPYCCRTASGNVPKLMSKLNLAITSTEVTNTRSPRFHQ